MGIYDASIEGKPEGKTSANADALSRLVPGAVFSHFAAFCDIPRPSGGESAVADYCEGFADNLGLRCERDARGNLLIKKPGRGDRSVILQGHLDMVCEKNADSPHSFGMPLNIRIDGDFIKADKTTLGADNGIGAAMALALLEENAPLPPLRVLLTTNEETGMEGAHGVSPDWLDADYLINLDTEEEGVFVAGCAGGAKPRITLPVERGDINAGGALFKVNVFGLMGGHSGTDIEKGRANACVLSGRALERLLAIEGVQIISVNGGLRDNAIPREGEIVFAAPGDKSFAVFDAIGGLSLSLKREFRESDPGVCAAYSNFEGEAAFGAMTSESARKLAAAINLMPYGVMELSQSLKIVETSNNLGMVKTENDSVTLLCAARSNVPTRLDWVLEKITRLAEVIGADITIGGQYPGWEYCPDSRLLKVCRESFDKLYGKEAEVSAIHAGLECGLLLKKNPRLDAISIGPDIQGAHTPSERASIQSVKRTYSLLMDILVKGSL